MDTPTDRPFKWASRDYLICEMMRVQDEKDPLSVKRTRELQNEIHTRTERRLRDTIKRNTALLQRHGVIQEDKR